MNLLKTWFGGAKKSELEILVDSVGTLRVELYHIVQGKRLKKLTNASVTLRKSNKGNFQIYVLNMDDSQQEFNFPIHPKMKLVGFPLGQEKYCFEWQLEEQSSEYIAGLKFKNDQKDAFKKMLCMAISNLFQNTTQNKEEGEDIKESVFRQLPGAPVYGQKKPLKEQELNNVLMSEISRKETKMVNSGQLFVTVAGKRYLENENAVFVISSTGNFSYQMYVLNKNNTRITTKVLDQATNYQVNIKQSFIKWLNVDQVPARVYEMTFDKYDVAINVKFALQECFYEIRTKLIMKDNILESDRDYLRAIQEEPKPQPISVVKVYENPQKIELDHQKILSYEPQGLEKYEGRRVLTQAKKQNFLLLTLADKMEMLSLDQENHFKNIKINTLKDLSQKHQLIPHKTILHESDRKALIMNQEGILADFDLEKGKVIEEYRPSGAGLKDFVAEKKLAEIGEYSTFVANDQKNIYRLDLRVPKTAIAEHKQYVNNPMFTNLVTNSTGNVAVGSLDGQIRLYKGVSKNANTKYPGLGDPVIHLETTKNNKWLLSTFQKYLILLPTFDDEKDLYENKVKIESRPKPIKLTIKFDHLVACGVSELRLLPAKFDETTSQSQKFIVSGFQNYVVIWSLSEILSGNYDYTFSKIDDLLYFAEFRFDDTKKLLMTTKKQVKVQLSTIKSQQSQQQKVIQEDA